MILVIASILGYMTENIWVGLRFGYWDNRGMMMPGLLGYGMAIVGLYLILGLPQKPMLFGHEFFFENSLQGIVFYYVAAGVLVSVAEIVLGNLWKSTVRLSGGIIRDCRFTLASIPPFRPRWASQQ